MDGCNGKVDSRPEQREARPKAARRPAACRCEERSRPGAEPRADRGAWRRSRSCRRRNAHPATRSRRPRPPRRRAIPSAGWMSLSGSSLTAISGSKPRRLPASGQHFEASAAALLPGHPERSVGPARRAGRQGRTRSRADPLERAPPGRPPAGPRRRRPGRRPTPTTSRRSLRSGRPSPAARSARQPRGVTGIGSLQAPPRCSEAITRSCTPSKARKTSASSPSDAAARSGSVRSRPSPCTKLRASGASPGSPRRTPARAPMRPRGSASSGASEIHPDSRRCRPSL